MDLERRKGALRRQMLERCRAITPGARRAAGERAAAHFLILADPLPPDVALFAALAAEIDTRPLFELLRSRGVRCLLPRSGPEDTLAFAAVERWEWLSPGRFGVPEPPQGARDDDLTPEAWVVVPGLAFDLAGRRLGRGGGFYDRAFPAGVPGPRLAGFAFDFQVVDRVPTGPRDRDVDAVVTEAGVRYALARGGEP